MAFIRWLFAVAAWTLLSGGFGFLVIGIFRGIGAASVGGAIALYLGWRGMQRVGTWD